MQGFHNSVKQYLKLERSRLKTWYQAGNTKNPVHVQLVQWERLKTYQSIEKQLLKSAKMQDAHNKVKHVSVVGKKGKASLEALAVTLLTFLSLCLFQYKEKQLQFLINVCYFDFFQVENNVSPSITEIEQGLQNFDPKGFHIDFAEIYFFQAQNEIQNMYWQNRQVTIMVHICYRKNPLFIVNGDELKVLKDVHFYISDNKEHDALFIQHCFNCTRDGCRKREFI